MSEAGARQRSAWRSLLLLTCVLAGPASYAAAQGPPPTTAPAPAPASARPRPRPAIRPTEPPTRPAPPAAKPAPAPIGKATVPLVVSKAKQQEGRRGSEFLRTPGTDRYDLDGVDWSEIPPWRQTSFFGIRARGQFFVYVVDCSGSMADEGRLARAKIELRQSIQTLQEPQRFQVIFYNDEAIPMPGGLPRGADLASKSQLAEWLRVIEPDGSTDPRPAIGLGLGLRPDAIFLLSDGEYPEGTVEAVARMNRRKVPIHCIDLSGGEAGDPLQRIAHDSGGRYVSRPWAGP